MLRSHKISSAFRAVFWLFLSFHGATAWSQDSDKLRDRIIREGGRVTPRITPHYASCQALIEQVSRKIFTDYELAPADSLETDPECAGNPLLQYAQSIPGRAGYQSSRFAAESNFTRARGSLTASGIALGELERIRLRGVSNNTIVRVSDALAGRLYGTALRHIGFFNGALVCTTDNGQRVLDLLMSEIASETLDSDLSPAEKKECIQGTFNLAVNVFDQRQYTGVSLVQNTYTARMAELRPILEDDYPVCGLGVVVYDFATGQMHRLRDKVCGPDAGGKGGKVTVLPKRDLPEGGIKSGRLAARNKAKAYRYLDGYLSMFADPRRFGTGDCSLWHAAGSDFMCFAGTQCGGGGAVPSVRSATDSQIRSVDDARNRAAIGPGSNAADFVVAGSGNPKKFGLPPELARQYLCEQRGQRGDEDASRGAFSPPQTPDWLKNPDKEFVSCQAAMTFANMMDETTACIMNGIREVLDLEKRAAYDPSVTMGGVKDPQCRLSEPRKNERNVPEPGQWAQTKISIGNLIELQERLAPESRDFTVSQVLTLTPVRFYKGLVAETGRVALAMKSKDSGSGYEIVVDADLAASTEPADVAKVSEAFISAAGYIWRAFNGLPNKKDDPYVKDADAAKQRRDEERKAHPDAGNQDPGDFSDPVTACSSPLQRAIDHLQQCDTPRKVDPLHPDNPASTGKAEWLGPDPRLINPGPDGVFLPPELIARISSCADQYGALISRQSGAAYGPNGCVPPLTQCSSTECKTYPSTCDFWGQWQCSYALCREDGACCSGGRSPGGGTPGDDFCGQITCGDGQVCNQVKKRCELQDLCTPGTRFNPATARCEVGQDGLPGQGGPGGDPEDPRNNRPPR